MTDVQDQAASQVRLAAVRLSRRLRAQKSDDRVTDSQMTVLMHLSKHGSMTLSELAEAERISAPSMNRTVDCLETEGHVVRTPDAVDRRKTNITATDSGREIVAATLHKRNAWLAERMHELTEAERTTLIAASEIMDRIATR
ncbi:DNA-binding transcriptional regulator, MarR family [Agromyces sp. CF514]|uniref:MarR family winged helix-turn-helix transcriptional regulator n=1 Tax=Agromyces sp. CF514 TaxID=1881031 RepID=UPI0008ECEDF8|nr:MarR family transcriptional regulator [Agromyces sp. CF514]SFR68614.1 DNA-binding transcriptional regulator, MarR family [Agromyces sp. CF514]